MPKKKTCAWKSELNGWQCPRFVWEDGGPDEKYCLFHSEQMEAKKEQFKKEIEAVKRGEPSKLYKSGQKKGFENCDFRGFHFPDGCSDFKGHRFGAEVTDFNEAQFSGHAWFKTAKFSGSAVFMGARFRGGAGFNKARFGDAAWFEKTKFSGDAEFSGARFSSDALFSEAQFSVGAGFIGASFSSDAVFIMAIFSGSANFDVASFSEDADFTGAKFKKDQSFFFNSIGELRLSGAECSGSIKIRKSNLRSIDALGMSYKELFTLEDVNFYGESERDKSDLNGVYLERAQFIGTNLDLVAFGGAFIREVIFDRVTFGKAAKGVRFWQVPWFSGRPNEAIYEERQAREKGLDDAAKKLFGSAETVYRTLKHVMTAQHAGNLARRMRAGELEMRLHGSASWWEKILLIGFRFLNGYGLRWLRALVFWLICVLSFAFWGYLGREATYKQFDLAQQQHVVRAKEVDFWEATWHSLEMTSVIATPSLHIENPGVRWLEGLERVLSPALLLLFLQAARNAARD